jgi:hypothetical protein
VGNCDPNIRGLSDANRSRCPEACAKKSAAKSLGIDLVAQRGDLRVGELPACLIIVIGLRQHSGARREHRQHRHPCRGCRASWGVDAGEEVRFALDSPLEGDGFELPVPREKKPRNSGIPLEFN